MSNSIQNNKYNSLIISILEGGQAHQKLAEFINLCCSISAAYLKNELYYNRLYFPIIYKEDHELKDICLDLIAPLFERDESNSFVLFRQNISLDAYQSVDNALYNRLKSIIISKTRQELIERFKEEEPGGYKILRNIKLSPTRKNNIKKFDDQYNTYLYYLKGECQEHNILDHLRAKLPQIEEEELLELVRIVCKKYATIPKILENILINIQKNNTCSDFVELTALFKAIKNVMLYKTVPLVSIIEHNGYKHNVDDFNTKILQELDESIQLTVKEKYINTNKIDENVANYYKLVLKEYFKDMILAHSGNNPLPQYLYNEHSTHIPKDTFTQHKTRIEYLIKILKKNIEQIISKY